MNDNEQYKNYVWLDKEGTKLPMIDMDAEHLKSAFNHACMKEFIYHQRTGFFSDLRDQLEEVAEKRGIELIYPDENHPSPKWKGYFNALRKRAQKVFKPTVLEDKLEEVNSSGDAS